MKLIVMEKMLNEEKLDAVFIVAGYDPEGNPLYPQLSMDAMKSGCHVWMEKPPAANVDKLKEMIDVSEGAGKYLSAPKNLQ